MTQQTSLFKTMCLYLAIALVALLAIGPFLHAHYGASQVTGLHVAGVGSVVVSAEPALTMTSFSQDDEPESAAVGVETSYARQAALDVEEQPQSVLILTVFVMAALIQRVVSFLLTPDTQRAGRPSFLAGFPPLPHAPPTSRF
ncbi:MULTISPECIES: hypothetical protein [Limnohabitans]|uniref:hypothetical protein n=1 Tax=Limnohabitans TaxID=665874 RepID=UPI000D3A8144|nr:MULTISPECIES: hypothetical protein [Limnohabitans]